MARVEPYVKVKEVIRDNPDLLAVDGQVNIGCVIVAPVGPQLAYIDGPASFLKNYTVDGVTIPRDADITFINAYYLSFSSGLVVARSMNSDATGGAVLYLGTKGITGSATNIYFKDGVQLKKKLNIGISGIIDPNAPIEDATEAPTEGASEASTEGTTEAPTEGATEAPTGSNGSSGWAFMINDTLYYGGDYDKVIEELSKLGGLNSDIDFTAYEAVKCDDLYTEGSSVSYAQACLDYIASDLNRQDAYVASADSTGITIYMDEFSSVTANKVDYINEQGESAEGDITPLTCSITAGDPENLDPESNNALLTMRCKTPQDSGDAGNLYTVAFSKPRYGSGSKLLFDLTISIKNQESQTYVVSFDKEAVDSSGLNCYIEVLNTYDNMPIEFIAGDISSESITKDIIKSFSQISFGHAFLSTAKSKEVAYMKDALNSLEDQETYRISYLAPVGITNVAFLKAYTSLGIRKRWFAPVDIPWDRTNVSSIKSFGDNIDDSYSVYVVGPFDKNSGLTGWVNYIAATTLYWERVMINRAANSEFAPVFDQRTGLLNYTNPVKLLKKSNREKLISLSKPINWVIYDMNSGAYYLNDNWNHYSKSENVVGEECNARMIHRISNDLEELYKQFKARHNTVQTRRSVHNVTNLYFQQNIMNQEYKPAEYRIVCDESNNTDDIIRGRKLAIKVQVRLYNSTKYIDVINEVYSVGGEPFVE